MGKFPRKVIQYRCPQCEELYETEEEAMECCPLEEEECWQCVECDSIYEEKEDAYRCCE